MIDYIDIKQTLDAHIKELRSLLEDCPVTGDRVHCCGPAEEHYQFIRGFCMGLVAINDSELSKLAMRKLEFIRSMTSRDRDLC